MATVVLAPYNVVNFPEGGGHFWVYMQYAQGLRRLGCDVYWLEGFYSGGDREQEEQICSAFFQRLARHGLGGKAILYRRASPRSAAALLPLQYLGWTSAAAETVLRRADLLLNFTYGIDPALLALFRRTALVDIDPGLLQFWISRGQLCVPPHDCYFTTGETVGTARALFPDCGLTWHHIRPPVSLDCWPYVAESQGEAFTTLSNWWGGEWLADGEEVYDNNKRASFLPFIDLPRRTRQSLELALYLGAQDQADRQLLEAHGWRVRHSFDVAANPEAYQSYIQGSRGEFSCAKPSCMKFQNAWVSDRSLCYLASGKPVVVQHTGPSSYLPNGEGMFRFQTLDEAAHALETINADYERQRRAARAIAETHFDAKKVLQGMLSHALG